MAYRDFSGIMQKLGMVRISETFLEAPSRPLYEISYLIGPCRVLFQSLFKDGRDSEAFILKEPLGKTAGFPHMVLAPVD